MEMVMTPEFWVALMQIILINIVLSGDNAVVIALACRSLPPQQQKNAIIFGSVSSACFSLKFSLRLRDGAGAVGFVSLGSLREGALRGSRVRSAPRCASMSV